MSEKSDARLGLSEFLEELIVELSNARSHTKKDNLNYEMNNDVTLELDIAYTLTRSTSTSTNVKTKFWVLGCGPKDAKDSLPSAQCNTQHLILRLTPKVRDVHVDEFESVETTSTLLPPERLEVWNKD